MDNKQKISKSAKQCNYIETKPISQQVKDLLIEELKKKKNKHNKLMNRTKLLHKKTNNIQVSLLQVLHIIFTLWKF